MGKKLYIGNLGYDVSSSDLHTMLAPHGTVLSAEVISDRATGQSKGFGFVEMDSDAEAQAAISALDGVDNAVQEGLARANEGDLVVVSGSLFVAAEARETVLGIQPELYPTIMR